MRLRRSHLRVNFEDEIDWLEQVHQPSHPLLRLTNGVMVYLALQVTWWSELFSEPHPSHRRHFHSSHLPKTRPSHQTLTHHERNETRLFEDVFPFELLGAALDVWGASSQSSSQSYSAAVSNSLRGPTFARFGRGALYNSLLLRAEIVVIGPGIGYNELDNYSEPRGLPFFVGVLSNQSPDQSSFISKDTRWKE